MAIFWAFSSMIFAALNDLFFKFYARKSRSHGLFCSIIGIIWGVMLCFFIKNPITNWRSTLIWGAISGFFSIGGNLLMLEAMKKLDAGVCSTIYRLNLVPAVIFAALFLGEKITFIQYIAIGCACLAVLAFIPKNSAVQKEKNLSLIIMVIASLMRAGMGISYRYGFNVEAADAQVVPVINSLFWIFGGIVYAFWREKNEVKNLSEAANFRKLTTYGVLSGVLVGMIVWTMAKALSYGEVALVLPIMQLSFLGTGILSIILMNEKVTLLKIVALLLGVTAILLLSLP